MDNDEIRQDAYETEVKEGDVNPAPVDGDAPAAGNGGAATESRRSEDRERQRSRSRSRSRSPRRDPRSRSRSPDPYSRPRYRDDRDDRRGDGPPAVRRPPNAPADPEPTETLGVFGLSVRTMERDLHDEFSRHGQVESVTIVYDQRSGRSRGFGFIKMGSKDDAANCIAKLNGLDLNGRRMRVDYSVTKKPHQPTPGEYMGVKRPEYEGERDRFPPRGGPRYDDRRGGGGGYGGGYDDRRGGYDDRDRYGGGYRDRGDYYDNYRRDRDPYPSYSRDERRTPPRRRRDSISPPPRRSRYSASPDPRDAAPAYAHRDYDAPPPVGDRPDPRY